MSFDKSHVIEKVMSLVPEGFAQKRIVTGMFKVETVWSKGELRKISIDGRELHVLKKEQCQEIMLDILKNSGRLRRNFSGRITLTAYLANGKIDQLSWDASNRIISRNSNYQSKLNQKKS